MKRFKQAMKYGAGLALVAAGSAHAALPTAVSDAVTAAETDLSALYVLLIGAGATLWVLRIISRKFGVR